MVLNVDVQGFIYSLHYLFPTSIACSFLQIESSHIVLLTDIAGNIFCQTISVHKQFLPRIKIVVCIFSIGPSIGVVQFTEVKGCDYFLLSVDPGASECMQFFHSGVSNPFLLGVQDTHKDISVNVVIICYTYNSFICTKINVHV